MNKHAVCLTLVLIPAILAAPLSRIYKNENYISAETNASKQLEISGLTQVNVFQSTNAGPYQVQEFVPQYCDGSILILPVYRNAEGTHILKHLIGNDTDKHKKDIKQGIIFQQKIYQQLPQWQFTFYQAKIKFQNLFHLANTDMPALIFAEQGQCKIAHYLASHAVVRFSK